MQNDFTQTGFGLGLRPAYFDALSSVRTEVDWLEIMSEDYFMPGGYAKQQLFKLRELYPMVMHGVGLSIGSTDSLNKEYLAALKSLNDDIKPLWVSDHLCWTGVNHFHSHDLLPLPYTQEALEHVIARIHYVQEYLGREMVFENASSYVAFKTDQMTEAEFLTAMSAATGCHLLLDVNNVYVNSVNHQFDPTVFIQNLPANKIVQYHLAGHKHCGTHIVDTHDARVADAVWALYAYAIKTFGQRATLLEWDDQFPPFEVLLDELQLARHYATKSLATRV